MNADVVISGAGPNGLMLAGELALAGIRPVVLELLPAPSREPKANGLIGQVARMLDMRGLYGRFSGLSGPPQPMLDYIFSGLPLRLSQLESNPMYALPIPQPELVRLLHEWVTGLGVRIRWGHELVDLADHGDGVRVAVRGPDGPYELDARFLVAADGGRSPIRKARGIAFPGHTNEAAVTRIGHVSLPAGLRTEDGGLDVPGVGRLAFGHNRLDRGMFAFAELQPGRPLIAVSEIGGPVPDGPMTFGELGDATRRVLGGDLPIESPAGDGPHALRRVTGQNTRLAERYRDGAVFLLGDAAHVHSGMGGPGLNLGLQDAVNLGWKLAAHLHGWAPPDLLDTYHSERHPVGERVMMSSLAQTGLMMPGPEVTALRRLFGELLGEPGTLARVADLMAGTDTVYETGDAHPLSGRMVPEATIDSERGPLRVAELLHRARPVLVDLSDDGRFGAAAGDRIDVVRGTGSVRNAMALLIRPDGFVAWATDGTASPDALEPILSRWFGRSPVAFSDHDAAPATEWGGPSTSVPTG